VPCGVSHLTQGSDWPLWKLTLMVTGVRGFTGGKLRVLATLGLTRSGGLAALVILDGVGDRFE
jgi:hypothetical protein